MARQFFILFVIVSTMAFAAVPDYDIYNPFGPNIRCINNKDCPPINPKYNGTEFEFMTASDVWEHAKAKEREANDDFNGSSMNYLFIAAEKGNDQALIRLAEKYVIGKRPYRKDKEIAQNLLKAAKRRGSRDAGIKLGDMFYENEDYIAALSEYLVNLKNDDIEVRMKIAMCEYELTLYESAIEKFEKLIESAPKHLVSKCNFYIGESYRKLNPNSRLSLTYYSNAISADYNNTTNYKVKNDEFFVLSLLRIIQHYSDTLGSSDKENMEVLLDLSYSNNPEVLYEIASRYIKGKGCLTDPDKALYYSKKSADIGYYPAQCQTGIIFEYKGNYEDAIKYYTLSANNGFEAAKELLNDLNKKISNERTAIKKITLKITATHPSIKKIKESTNYVYISWKTEVKNPFHKEENIGIKLILKDGDGFKLDDDYGTIIIPANSTRSFTETLMIEKNIFRRCKSYSIEIK